MRDHRFLAVLALALVVRVLVVVETSHFVPRNDAWDYDRIAVSLVQRSSFPPSIVTPRPGPTAYRPPLFPLALAGVYKVVGVGSATARWTAARIFEAVLGTAAVALIYQIALSLWGPAVALGAGVIAAVYPPLLLVGSSLMSESLFIPLVLVAVAAALRSRRAARPLRWAALAGALVGLASLTRGNGIVLLIPVGFMVWSERPRRRLRSVRAPLALGAAALVVLIPWTVRNAVVFHRFVPLTTEAGYTLAGAYNGQAAARSDFPFLWTPPVADFRAVFAADPAGNEAEISDRLSSRALHYVDAHPRVVPNTLFWNALRLLNLTGPGVERWGAPYESYPRGLAVLSVYAFWALGALALAGALTRATRRAPLAMWCCPLAMGLSALPLIATTRMRSPADPFLIMLAALAVTKSALRQRNASSPHGSHGLPGAAARARRSVRAAQARGNVDAG